MLGVLHTTESDPGSGPAVVNYFLSAAPDSIPHAVFDPSTGFEHVFLSATLSSKSLRNLAGGVETNNREGGVWQVEIIGRAADVSTYSDEWYAALRAYLWNKSHELGIAYQIMPCSRGRLTFEEWLDPSLVGWVGHCNVPENTHWDPGALDLSRLNHVEPSTVTDINLAQTLPNTGWTIGDVLNWIKQDTSTLKADLAALRAQVAALQVGSPATIDVSAIARAVAAELALRLQA